MSTPKTEPLIDDDGLAYVQNLFGAGAERVLGTQCVRPAPEPSGERRLLLFVLRQCLLDLTATTLDDDAKTAEDREAARQDALDWINSDAEYPDAFSFVTVCDHLGVTPECMRRAILDRLASGTLVVPRSDPTEPHHVPDAQAVRAA